ncbi:MAG TPA: hypothetical protein ENG70_01025 [Candidatus Cloacimonetes bacterium]|nr:hypothetical protein [Candidatus Cloacimonadota bacterium]HEX37437.1 hypothetical protein [Candidatus Cloacimonadota bacterium]
MEEKQAKVFKFKDIFQAWNHSFRFHRLMISGIAYILIGIIAFLLLNELFRMPKNISEFYNSFQIVLNVFSVKTIIGIILIAFIWLIARMSIAYSIRTEVIDDEIFVGWKDVFKFWGKHLKTFVFYVLGWILIFVLIALGHLFFYVIGMIPYVGSLWLSIMYLIPLAISVFAVLSLIILFFTCTYGAVIVGVEQESAMDSIISLYHLIKDHGIYIIATHALSWIVGTIAFCFVFAVVQGAVALTSWGAHLIMGKEFMKITIPKFFSFLHLMFPGLNMGWGAGGYYVIPGFIIGIFLIIIAAVTYSYMFTYMSAAETFIYLSSQDKFYPKRKDDELDTDLDEEEEESEDEVEEEEEVEVDVEVEEKDKE